MENKMATIVITLVQTSKTWITWIERFSSRNFPFSTRVLIFNLKIKISFKTFFYVSNRWRKVRYELTIQIFRWFKYYVVRRNFFFKVSAVPIFNADSWAWFEWAVKTSQIPMKSRLSILLLNPNLEQNKLYYGTRGV